MGSKVVLCCVVYLLCMVMPLLYTSPTTRICVYFVHFEKLKLLEEGYVVSYSASPVCKWSIYRSRTTRICVYFVHFEKLKLLEEGYLVSYSASPVCKWSIYREKLKICVQFLFRYHDFPWGFSVSC
mgnify:CR=1 FL=1